MIQSFVAPHVQYETAKDLLGWSRDKVREQQASRVGVIDAGSLVEALDIMDSRGRHNPEGNSTTLWDAEWEQLRRIICDTLETARELVAEVKPEEK